MSNKKLVTAVNMENTQLCGAKEISVARKGKRYMFKCATCGAAGRVNATGPDITVLDLEEKWPEALAKMEHIPRAKA